MIHFDLADLRLFINIAETPSMTQGARKSFMSTAAASNRIKKLEEQVGQPLLYRDSRGVELTAAGDTMLKHGRVKMSTFALTVYVLIWPVLSTLVLVTLCVALIRDIRAAKKDGESLV